MAKSNYNFYTEKSGDATKPFIGKCREFSNLGYLAKSRDAARSGIKRLVDRESKVKKPVAPVAPVVPTRSVSALPKLNRVALLLDESGSMSGLSADALVAVNTQLDALRTEALRTGQKTLVSIFGFGWYSTTRVLSAETDVTHLRNLTRYQTDGNTPLNDCVKMAVENLLSTDPLYSNRFDVSQLVILITDGAENSSKFSTRDCNTLIKDMVKTDRWSFVFMVPPGSKQTVANNYGLFSGNVQEWEQSSRGIAAVTQSTTKGLNQYFTSRSLGQTSTQTFYTDLSNITSKHVSNALDDVSNNVRVFTVKTEEQIRDFVEKMTKTTYVAGSAYYQLMKEEKKVQPYKKFVVLDKTKNKYFGGVSARQLLGLPDNATVRVVPQNHSNFEVFVQSTSVNRKLPRGTKVVVVG